MNTSLADTVNEGKAVEQRVKVSYQGKTVDAEEMEFKTIAETAGEYQILANGTKIDFGHHVKTIYRLCDEKKPDGSPVYLVAGEAKLNITPAKEDGKA